QICLSRGRSQNEMTQFRYNVLLHIEQSQICCEEKLPRSLEFLRLQEPDFNNSLIQQYNWKIDPITVEEIQKDLIKNELEILIITNVVNSRVNAAVKTVTWLRNKEAPKTVGRMRDMLQDSTDSGIDPQDWWDLEAVLPYDVEITWSTQTHTGDYDVLLIRHGVNSPASSYIPQQIDQSWYHYTNNPLQSQFARQLIPLLRQYLRQTLPDYMVPSTFVPLEIPLTANGKVDYLALPISEDLISTTISAEGNSAGTAPLTQTESTLIDIWQELLRLKQVNIHDNFFELGGHSLLATQITSRVRDVFGLELPLKSVFEAPTIAQLAPIIASMRDTTSTMQPPPLVRLERSAYRHKRSKLVNDNSQILLDLHEASPPPNDYVDVTQSRSPLVPLTLGDSKQPFFCVHPMFGVVFPYLELAHHLGCDRSFYGLQPLGLDGKHPPLTEIEAIAAYYIRAIQTLQPQGPYFLGGWSFGGLVAFEMAQQLTKAGQEIGLLAIFDTSASFNKPSLCQSLKFLLGTALWSTLPFLLDYGAIVTNLFQPLQKRKAWFSRWQWSAIIRLIPEESRLQLLDESAIAPMLRVVYANAQAASRYVPQKYPNRITLFKADVQSDVIGQDSTLGWSALASDIQLHQVPGNHLSLLKQPHVQTLAQQLRQYLL
nr:non-ribosomal peptide synthetase [Nostocaceae cyanobacterium]